MRYYYSNTQVYAYPSSNAENGGEDNSEYNLKTVSNKFMSKNFVIKRPGGVSDNYFALSTTSGGKLKIVGGECCINGYYFKVSDIEITVGNLVTSPDPYYIVLRIHDNSVGNLVGNGINMSGSSSQIVSFSLTIEILNESEISAVNSTEYLILGTFITTMYGSLPSTYSIPDDRFSFLDPDTILDIGSKFENIIADKSQMTAVSPDIDVTSPDYTYNGESDKVARSDHLHDGRYVYKSREDDTVQTVNSPFTVRKTFIAGDSKGLSPAPFKVIPSSSPYAEDESIEANRTVTFSSPSNDWDTIIDGGNITTRGISSTNTVTSHLTVSGELSAPDSSATFHSVTTDNINTESVFVYTNITALGDITASGAIRGDKVYNAVWNDYAELVPKNPEYVYDFGDIICKCKNSDKYEASTRKSKKYVVGVCSNTYGHLLGGSKSQSLEQNLKDYIPMAVAGNVKVKIIGKIKTGDFVEASSIRGVGKKAWKLFSSGCIVGKSLEDKKNRKEGKVLIQICLC